MAVFTYLPVGVQICLNGEPFLSMQPDTQANTGNPATNNGNPNNNNFNSSSDGAYVLRKLRHSAGEVTCVSIDEHVSLPAEAEISVRFHSAAPAQAFMSIRKL
jgi:hypothetical protein